METSGRKEKPLAMPTVLCYFFNLLKNKALNERQIISPIADIIILEVLSEFNVLIKIITAPKLIAINRIIIAPFITKLLARGSSTQQTTRNSSTNRS